MQKNTIFRHHYTISLRRGQLGKIALDNSAQKSYNICVVKMTEKGHKAGDFLLKRAGVRCEPVKEACDLTPESSA